jgi:hypothetical protein
MPKQLVLPADTRSAAAATIPALETQNKKFRAPEPRTSELAAAKRNYQVVLKVKSNIYFAETAIALLCCIAFAPVCASLRQSKMRSGANADGIWVSASVQPSDS